MKRFLDYLREDETRREVLPSGEEDKETNQLTTQVPNTSREKQSKLLDCINQLGYTDVEALYDDVRAVAMQLQINGAEQELGPSVPPLGNISKPNIKYAPNIPPN